MAKILTENPNICKDFLASDYIPTFEKRRIAK
jgi:hypothetical protein